ncbi:MAG: hypothetical protein CYG60_14590 [Actinobacteria bacterium]|nr:MAG: hypothetical protein CYG60_14590 [Actinomycetota bacterium]
MDQQQQQNVNRAAQEWTEAVRQSFRTLADQTVQLQETNLKLIQTFFQQSVEQLQSSPEWQQRGEEQQRVFEALAKDSANAYSDYLNSALSFYQQTMSQATQVAQSNLRTAEQVARQSVQASEEVAEQVVVASGRVAQQAIASAAGQGVERTVPTSSLAAQGDEEPASSRYKAPDRAAAMRLIDDLLSEDSSYDEETWPEIAEALDRDRPSRRKLFVD